VNHEDQKPIILNETDIEPIAVHAATLAVALLESYRGALPGAVGPSLYAFADSVKNVIQAEELVKQAKVVMAQRANDLLAAFMTYIPHFSDLISRDLTGFS